MRNERRGQSLVEFALVLPLMLLLIFGIIDFSYYIYGKATIQFAAFRGAQQAATQPPQVLRNGTNTAFQITDDSCLARIYEQAKAGTVGFTPANGEITFRWTSIQDTTETLIPSETDRNTIVVPNTIVEVRIQRTVQPLTPLARTVFRNGFMFDSRSRRTVMNFDVGPSNDCQ